MASYHTSGLGSTCSSPNDPYFNCAKEKLFQLTRDLYNSNMHYQNSQNADFLLAQLNAWEQASQNLQQQMASAQLEHQHLLNTVFKFEPDHFKMLVDVRGYQPAEIKLTVTMTVIEITASHEQTIKEQAGSGYANRTISKLYEMPLNVSPDHVSCNLTPEGTLLITAPWIRNC